MIRSISNYVVIFLSNYGTRCDVKVFQDSENNIDTTSTFLGVHNTGIFSISKELKSNFCHKLCLSAWIDQNP